MITPSGSTVRAGVLHGSGDAQKFGLLAWFKFTEQLQQFGLSMHR
ncbi:hypothetical protein [Rhodopirellula europaea]